MQTDLESGHGNYGHGADQKQNWPGVVLSSSRVKKDSGKVSETNQRSQEALESQHPALSVPLPYWSGAQVFRQEVEEEARSLTTELLRTHNLMGRSELYPGTQWDTRHTHNH